MREELPLTTRSVSFPEGDLTVQWVEYLNALVTREELDAAEMFDETIGLIISGNFRDALETSEYSEDATLSEEPILESATRFSDKFFNGSSDGLDEYIKMATFYAQGFDLLELDKAWKIRTRDEEGAMPRWNEVYGPKAPSRKGRARQKAARDQLRKNGWRRRDINALRESCDLYVIWRHVTKTKTLQETLEMTMDTEELTDEEHWNQLTALSRKMTPISRLLGEDPKDNRYGKHRSK